MLLLLPTLLRPSLLLLLLLLLPLLVGGCVSLEASNALIAGSSFSHCNARFVGGGIASLASHVTIKDSTIANSYADMVSSLPTAGDAPYCIIADLVCMPFAASDGYTDMASTPRLLLIEVAYVVGLHV
jgi:hypothetical protein